MAMRKRNPLSINLKDYFSSRDSFSKTKEEWIKIKENELVDTDYCDVCNTWIGPFEHYCPKCKF